MGAFVISPLPPLALEEYEQQGPFAPRALPRLTATAGPSATLSPPDDFPGVSGYTAGLAPPLSRAGRGGLPQLLGMSLSPCRRYHPAGADRLVSQPATIRAAFA